MEESCEVRMVKELPAGVSILWINDYHLLQEIELDLIHILQSFAPIGCRILNFDVLQCIEEMLVEYGCFLYSYD